MPQLFRPASNLLQLSRQKQSQKDLSGMSKGLEGRIEVVQNLSCWQDMLTAHSLELAELINNLDEEATADIRKVPLRQQTSGTFMANSLGKT